MASGKVIFSAFIRNCTGPPFASQTKQRYELRPGLSYDSVDGRTMKFPSVLSSWNGHSPVRFTPALRSVTKSPTTSSIFACSMTVLMMSSLIFGIVWNGLKRSYSIKGVNRYTIKGGKRYSIKGGYRLSSRFSILCKDSAKCLQRFAEMFAKNVFGIIRSRLSVKP